MRALAASPLKLNGTYFDRLCQAYIAVLQMDPHKPFTSPGVCELIDKIAPQYLTYEYITQSRQQHMVFIKQQNAALML